MKRILKGIWKGIKDVAPIPTKEMGEYIMKSGSILDGTIQERTAEKLASRLTSFGSSIIILLYLIDELFKVGIFN